MKSAFLIALLSVISIFSFAQSAETVFVRVTETWVPAMVSYREIPAMIQITYSDGKTEVIELEAKGLKHINANTIKIQKAVSRFMTDEYELLSTTATATSLLNNYLWVFKKK